MSGYFLKILVIHLGGRSCPGSRVGRGSVVEDPAGRSHSVSEFVLVFIRILSRNRAYFPVHGAEVGVEVNVSLECSRPELSFCRCLCVDWTGSQCLEAQLSGAAISFLIPFLLFGGR